MPKYSSRLFQGVQKKNVQKSTVDLSHEWKHDFQIGDYTPMLKIPTLPGGEYEIETDFFFKFEPLYYPIIHRCNLDADYFFVPNRIMWPATPGNDQTGWTNWIMLKNETEHPTIDVDMEDITVDANSNNSVMGYFGLPYLMPDGVNRTTVHTSMNAFPAMAYILIWDQYYRNPQLEDERGFPLVAGDNTAAMIAAYGFTTPTDVRLSCLPAKWALDYFTSAIPTPQAGDAITIPITDENLRTGWVDDAGNPVTGALNAATEPTGEPKTQIGATDVHIEATATMRQLRLAEVLQSFRESLIKIGQRYRDYIIGIFAEDPTPMDISVPMMIGNYKGIVEVSEVLSTGNFTSSSSTINKLADYAGNAGLYTQPDNKIRFQTKEHGLIIGIMNVMPNTGYGQGIERYWRYSTPYDYPMDIFSTVGDQEILKEEVFYTNLIADAAKNNETFGYIPKYSEARFINNSYGTNLAFRAGVSTHLGRWWNPETTTGADYDNRVELDEYFIAAAGSVDAGNIRISDVFRVLTLQNAESVQKVITGYLYHRITARIPLPLYSTPGLV